MTKRVLLYYLPNNRSIAIETLCKAVKEGGYELLVLTLTERGPFHEAVEKMGIETHSYILNRKPSWKYFLGHTRYLIKFCKQHQIDVIWSHLQDANFVAVIAQPFIKAKVTVFRHHAESAFYKEMGKQFGMSRNKNEQRFDKITDWLAKKIVIPSSGVWYSMEKHEGCNMKKVRLIPYIYDFTTYPKPDIETVKLIRDQHACQLLLIMVSRMISSKQHMPVFEVIKKLAGEGFSVKMIVMDDGPLRSQLAGFVNENKLNNHIFFTGFRNDLVNYMAAADLLMHPSVTEASSNVVKEMGLMNKAVAVCEHVGDFDDYITDRENGYILKPATLKDTIETAVRDAYNNKEVLAELGIKLNQSVFQRFSDSQENRSRFLKLI